MSASKSSQSNSEPNDTSLSLSSGPTSPTPDAALGLDIGHDTSAERMRRAWGTIRERLGLRRTPPAPPTHLLLPLLVLAIRHHRQ